MEFELAQPSSEPLDIVWEYWDGEVWRGFLASGPACERAGDAEQLDGTPASPQRHAPAGERLRRGGEDEVDGIEGYWIRGRLDEPLPPDPGQVLPEVSQLRLATVIERPLDVLLAKVAEEYPSPPRARGRWSVC